MADGAGDTMLIKAPGVTNVNKSDSWINIIGPAGGGERERKWNNKPIE